jgi:hypothetical protein
MRQRERHFGEAVKGCYQETKSCHRLPELARATRRSDAMDDKSLNLWRQIEGCRRARKIMERRVQPATQLASAVANDLA